jgi:predicted RNase H-like nuclease (RuvC/YqgF family)
MTLWVKRPAQPASVPEEKEPRWDSFEKVHISLDLDDVLAALEHSGPKEPPTRPVQPSANDQAPSVRNSATASSTRDKNLNEQIQELGSSNQQLRTQVEQQTKELDTLREDLRRLRDDLKAQKNAKPSLDRKPSRKQPSE